MKDKIAQWLLQVCLLGLLPVIARMFIWLVTNSGIEPFAIGDLVLFGLVLQSYTMNEISNSNYSEKVLVRVQFTFAFLLTVLFALVLAVTLAAPDNLNEQYLFKTTLGLSIVSFILGFFILITPKMEPNHV